MPPRRMNREEFFAKLAPLDEDKLRKVLWTLYWRGSAPLRERIEGELDPAEQDRRKRAATGPAEAVLVLSEVSDFAELARSGAYMGGDRRVSPRERSRWRVTFRRLAADAQSALRGDDPETAQQALALVIDLACEMRDHCYFHSEDAVEAARFVVSDAAALLWETVADRQGFRAFADTAAPQLLRWELRYGWTNGWGKVGEKETSLATVITRMLRAADMWAVFADRYLDALDEAARADAAGAASRRSYGYRDTDYLRSQRADNLAEWHDCLLERLYGSEAEDRLDRLVNHRALGGPEATFLQARLAHLRGDLDDARTLARACLERLPGHQDFAEFAVEIGADLPPRAREPAGQQLPSDPVRAPVSACRTQYAPARDPGPASRRGRCPAV